MQIRALAAMSIAAIAGLATTTNAQVTFDGWNFAIAYGSGDAVWRASDNAGSWNIVQTNPQGDEPVRYRVVGDALVPGQFSAHFELELDPDPFVSSFFTVNNLTNGLQPFTITTSLATIPVGAPSTMTGSISGTVGDGDGLLDQFGNGATVRSLGGAPYYEALTDGFTARQLYPANQVNSAPLILTQPIAQMQFVNEVGPGVAANIGIRNRFELTPGDNASFTSTFFIIPTPSVGGVLVLAGLAAARRRR